MGSVAWFIQPSDLSSMELLGLLKPFITIGLLILGVTVVGTVIWLCLTENKDSGK
jgi:hypothetical protein